MTEFNGIIQQAHDANERYGVNIKGKRYLSVAHRLVRRVAVARKNYGRRAPRFIVRALAASGRADPDPEEWVYGIRLRGLCREEGHKGKLPKNPESMKKGKDDAE